MEYNILFAIKNLVENEKFKINYLNETGNRLNNMGDGLEYYVKDLFSGALEKPLTKISIDGKDQYIKEQWKEAFSWYKSGNKIPDAILKKGDAIEVKKNDFDEWNKIDNEIHLNSSFPKNKLSISDISEKCKIDSTKNEDWEKKDIIYAIGHVEKQTSEVKSLCFVYGTEYAANKKIYSDFLKLFSEKIEEIENITITKSKEVARVNNIGPLKNAKLRLRGMWLIDSPYKVFKDIYTPLHSKFNFMTIISEDKYNSFPEEDKKQFKALVDNPNNNLKMVDKSVKDPDDISKTKKIKLITFTLDDECDTTEEERNNG